MRSPLPLIVLFCTGVGIGAAQSSDMTLAVIPRPVHMTRAGSAFVLTPGTVIVTDRATRDIGYQLADWLAPATGYRLPVTSAAGGAAPTISLRLDSSLARLGDEGYQLSVTSRQITIRARRPAGAFYAIETLRQLLPPDILRAAPAVGVTWTVPGVQIEDSRASLGAARSSTWLGTSCPKSSSRSTSI